MSIFDKAKSKLSEKLSRAGEEMVRVIDDDEEELEDETPSDDYSESAFDVPEETKGFFKQKQKQWEEQNSSSIDLNEISASDGKVADVLYALKIPATFEIPAEILMTEDLEDLEFDIQVPQGYDTGQVESFLERARKTIEYYLDRLQERNDQIALMATTVDRLQVDANNLRFESEISNGINIMPTDNDTELSRENAELRILVASLRDQLQASTGEERPLSDEDRTRYNLMRDEVARLEKVNEELEDEASNLRLQLALYEENEDDEPQVRSTPQRDSLDELDDELPDMSLDDDERPPVRHEPQKDYSGSAFAIPEDTIDEFVQDNAEHFAKPEEESDIDFMGATPPKKLVDYDDDDDDFLDSLIDDWNK